MSLVFKLETILFVDFCNSPIRYFTVAKSSFRPLAKFEIASSQ